MEVKMGKEKEEDIETFVPAKPLLIVSPSLQNSESESEKVRFDKSLMELKGLRAQLNNAADYCDNAFFKATHKKILLENTRNYICEAIVTVVDHLGTVSSNIEQQIDAKLKLSQTEQRIDCLKHRLLTWKTYDLSLDTTLQWRTKFPHYYRHYVLPGPLAQQCINTDDTPSVSDSDTNINDDSPCDNDKLTTVKDQLGFIADSLSKLHISNTLPGIKVGNVLPVFEDPPTPSKSWNHSFVFPAKDGFEFEVMRNQRKKPFQRSSFLTRNFRNIGKRRR